MWEEGALMNASAIRHGTLRNLSQSDHFKDVPFPVSALPLPPPTHPGLQTCRTNDDRRGEHVESLQLSPGFTSGHVFLNGKGSPSLATLRASHPTAVWVE